MSDINCNHFLHSHRNRGDTTPAVRLIDFFVDMESGGREMNRTALLIRCSVEEANQIRTKAMEQQNSISGYILQVMTRTAHVEDHAFANLSEFYRSQLVARRTPNSSGPRTAILVRCGVDQAEIIRSAAQRRGLRLNAFVLESLRKGWDSNAARQQTPMSSEIENIPSVAASQSA
jgi:uncharacterized protein (DUF1778 family)